ncbi:MAG: ABC transporter permease [Chitinophagaceae bacterium]
MIKHYIITAWRNLLKNKMYSGIHLSGLIIGITTCLLMAAYVYNEFSFDNFHKDRKSVYRINTDLILPEQQLQLSLASGAVAPQLKNDFPEVKQFTRIIQSPGSLTFQKEDLSFFEKSIIYADPGFFKVFDFELSIGNRTTVLSEPNEIILTKSLSKKYFGDQNPVGSTIKIDKELFKVTGIAANPPANSHLSFAAIISYATWVKKFPYTETNWGWSPTASYVLLNAPNDDKRLTAGLPGWLEKQRPSEPGAETKLSLEPLTKIHFNKPRLGDFKPNSNKTQVLLLALTGVFILLLALFNYINLATAVYTDRLKEIGVRKTFGASRKQISLQFLIESVLLSGIAMVIALLLAVLLLPWFNGHTGQLLTLNFLSPLFVISLFFVAVFIVGPLAGFYPSLILSSLKTNALFRNSPAGFGKVPLCRLLTSLQFVISIGLIISTILIWQQHNYMAGQSMGFAEKSRMVVQLGNAGNSAVPAAAIRQTMLEIPGVQNVALSSHIPGENLHGVGTTIKRTDGRETHAEMELDLVDFNFIDLYQLHIIAGRKFLPVFAEDTTGALILNETAARQLGFESPADIIGQNFSQWDRKGKVIGVVKDFNQHSLQSSIGPVSFQVNPALFEKMTISYQSADLPQLISQIENKWKQVTGNMPFDYFFLDSWIASQYDAERRFSKIFGAFALLAIFIACIGLYGLTTAAVKKRIKEIGIRKVLGASVPGIVKLFSAEIFKLVIASILVASPIAWYIMNRWLQGFAYKINIEWWVFAVAGGMSLLIALLVVGFQAIKAAVANPVKSLRAE